LSQAGSLISLIVTAPQFETGVSFMTRNLILSLVLVPALPAFAQRPASPAPPEGSNWQNVEALPAGTTINVKARAQHANCKLKSVTADRLTCSQPKQVVFQRTEILTIKIPRRGRSTLIATGVGAGAGGIVGAATTGCSAAERDSFFGCFLTPTRPEGAAIGAMLFGVIAAPIGYFSDFAKSTVYKAQ
jgi:hypothetical protein